MNTVLSFMDKLYSDSETLKIVYVVGAILLFVFIVLLIISIRKPDKKEKTKIIEEPKIDDEIKEEVKEPVIETTKEEIVKEEVIKPLEEQSIFEKTRIIPLDEIKKAEEKEIVEEKEVIKESENILKEESVSEIKENAYNLSKDIPDVDSFVDSVVKKTYEKNEQFSSVYVGNTSTVKLDKVLDNLNVDEDVKENIVPEEEKTVEVEEKSNDSINEEVTVSLDETKEEIENKKEEPENSLDNLKKALEDKKKEVELKQDDLKAKLQGLKEEKKEKTDALNPEDLLNKLNELKEK